MTDKPKRPRDANQFAKFIVDVATGDPDPETVKDETDQSAKSKGQRLGPVLIYLAPPVSVIFRQRQAILRRQGGPFSSRINAAMAENGEIPKGRGAFWQAIRVFRLPINQIAASKHPDCLPKWARAGGAR